jgi:ABC-type transport system involved in multi-copper enzyme maturation permease subunit
MKRVLTIAWLTLHEAARKRVLAAALLLGLAFVAVDAVGFHFIAKQFHGAIGIRNVAQARLSYVIFTLASLYAVHFLSAMAAVMLPVDTLSGEIGTGVMQTVASKPVRRSQIVLGKWLAYVLVTVAYQWLVAGGVLLVAALIPHYVPEHLGQSLPLMALEATALVTLSIAGGTRLSTVTNGMMAFGLFGLAFIGGWIEQIGTFTRNDAARHVGTAVSLFMPTDSMWQLAAFHLQPANVAQLAITPFTPASVPSPAMVAWAIGWTLAVLALALRGFAKRPL